ncbi:MAG TPA: outer membrane protein transport protein [Kofleriaceae bacterium]|nr:outer membrane protein transport protein [Kofleriaceae bacterium]
MLSLVHRLCVPRLCVIGATLAALAGHARAGGLVITAGSPRAIGRAGAGTVGDDGGGALLVNPAAMARRDGARGQLGAALVDDEISWEPENGPIARTQSPSSIVPTGAVIGSLGSWVIGVGVMTAAVSERSLTPPADFPPGELGDRFEFRYAGIAGGLRRDTVTAGVARRIGDALAVGLAVSASRVAVSERRRMWAGFGGRDTIGSPTQDIEVAMSGRDAFVPGAALGVLIAPEDASLELGASVGWSHGVRVDADFVGFGVPDGPTVQRASPSASLELRQPWALRAGARYLSERFVFELGGDLWTVPASAEVATWQVRHVSVVDKSGLELPLRQVPSRISQRTHGAIRGALDVEIFSGFLWATAGYAYAVGGVSGSRQSPTFGDLGGHTVAFGLEATTGGFTVTAGWSRTWSSTIRPASELALDNPFQAGDQACPPGAYDGSIDQLGILIDAELEAPN